MKNIRTEFTTFVVLTLLALAASAYYAITKQHAETANTLVWIATTQMVRLAVMAKRIWKRVVREQIEQSQAVDEPCRTANCPR